MALVVEVVQQARDAPQLLVLAEAAGVGAHRGLDGQHVLAQRRRFRPLAEEGPGLRARKLERHGWYPSPASGPDRRPSGPVAATPDGKARHRRRRAAVRHHRARRQQERGPAAAGRLPAHRRAGRAPQRAADPRHRGDDGAARGPRREGRAARRQHRRPAGRRGHQDRRRPRPGRADPRLVPGRRPAARPLRRGAAAAARRRRDRPPPAGSAPRRVPRARRGRRARARHPPARARRRPAGVRLLHGRAVRDGHRERADGGRAHARLDASSATRRPSRTCRTSRGC